MYSASANQHVAAAPDHALLYLSLHLLMEGLIERQQQLQRAENYSVRNAVGKLLRLHRSMSLRLVNILKLDMQRVDDWPSVKQIVSSLPQGSQQQFQQVQRELRQFEHSFEPAPQVQPTALEQRERLLVVWLKYAYGRFASPSFKALLADMIAAWQVCLEGVSSEMVRSNPR